MFAIVFSVILVIASIIFIKKKSFISLFFSLILFLPEYYGFSISASFPVISATRILFLIFYLYILFMYRSDLINSLKTLKPSLPIVFFAVYFVLRIATNLYYVTIYSQAKKTIISIFAEELLLLLTPFSIKLSKEKIVSLINAIVYGSCVMFVLGIFESLSFIRLSDYLYTVDRFMLNEHYIRLGLLRSTVTMGLPGFFGNLCVLTAPAIMFMYHHTLRKRYLFICALSVLACIHSGTRSALFFLIAVYCAGFILVFKDLEKRKLFLKNACIITFSLLVFMVIASFSSKYLKYYYVTSGKAMLNSVGFDFDLDEGAPKGVKGFGHNPDGNMSRLDQFSGILYVAKESPVFGLGSGAQTRRQAIFFTRGKWGAYSSYDVGYVQVAMDEGILGSLGYISLFVALFLLLFPKDKSRRNCFLSLTVFAYLICMFGTANMQYFLWTIIFIIVLYYKSTKVNQSDSEFKTA